MRRSIGSVPGFCVSRKRALATLILGVFLSAGWLLASPPAETISAGALAQIQALVAEKESRTPVERKIDSNLLYSLKMGRGQAIAAGVPSLETGLPTDLRSDVVVDISATVDPAFLQQLQMLGATIQSYYAEARSVRVTVALGQIGAIASLPQVFFVQPRQGFSTQRSMPPRPAALPAVSSGLLPALKPGFEARAASARSRLAAALAAKPAALAVVNVSEGDVTHRANLARSTFGINGSGVKVGVLSDGVDSLASLQTSGDLPAVTVLPGQAGSGDEGSAMLEIVHDLAPGAQLFFATADNGIASFAQNIKTLQAAGCGIIIDDVQYFVETPFQEGQAASVLSTTNGGLVTEAVNTVTAAGALYFTSVGNEGNEDSATSGTWEGDFANGGAIGGPITGTGNFNDFDTSGAVSTFDALTQDAAVALLWWSDPLGGSANDYDLFLLNSTGSGVVASSTNTQNGTQDPFEGFSLSGPIPAGDRLVIVKRTTAAARFLHLTAFRGGLTFHTPGEAHGHSAPPSANAFAVAATPAAGAFDIGYPTGPYPSPFNSGNSIELFSSDGPRRFFFNADSTPITPGNFSSTGGTFFNKPDLTAADGVSCAAPGFNPFYGTSAAAPHAGAIAALVKSRNPALTATQISSILRGSRIDIMAPGLDRDSGVGILDAFLAVQAAVFPAPTATKFFSLTPCRVVDTRSPGGPLAGPALVAHGDRNFTISGSCGVPATAKSIAVNLTITQAAVAGDLRIYPSSSPLPSTSVINYRAGQTRANNAVVGLGVAGDVNIRCDQPSGTVHFILDVSGYFE